MGPGKTVGLLLPFGVALVESLYGAWMNGNVVVVLNDQRRLFDLLDGDGGSFVGALIVADRELPGLEQRLRLWDRQPAVFVVGDAGRHHPYHHLLEAEPERPIRPAAEYQHVLTHFEQLRTTGDAMLRSRNLVAQVAACRDLLSVTSAVAGRTREHRRTRSGCS